MTASLCRRLPWPDRGAWRDVRASCRERRWRRRYIHPIGRSPASRRERSHASRHIVFAALAALFVSLSVAHAPARPVAATSATARFQAATAPCRLADVRAGTGFERLDAAVVRIMVAGRCGVPADATAVALTLTVDASRTPAGGYVSVWPEGADIPTASVVNHLSGEVRANGTVVGLMSGSVAVLSSTGAPVIADVTGWFVPAASSAAGRFVPVTPTRAVDTRLAPRAAPLTAGETVTVPLPPGIPTDAAAVAITVTTTESPGPGYLSVAPGGSGRPPASVLNTDARFQTRASGAIVGVTAAGLDVYSLRGGHVVVDVTGWFTGASAPVATEGLFVAERAPRRVLDTRRSDPIWAQGALEIGNVAPDAAALVLNVAIVLPRSPGYLTAYPARQEVPGTSTVNGAFTGEVAAAMAIVPTSQVGVGLFASHGADAVVDVSGWFTGTPTAAPRAAPANVRPPECASGTGPAALNASFAGGAAFTGADYQRPFLLPDGRALWVFQDVYVRGRGNRSTFVHNAALVQNGPCFTVLYSGDFASPGEYLFPDVTQRERHWYWPLAGEMGADGLFHLFVVEMRENGPTYLSRTEPLATWKVAIDLTTMRVVDRRPAIDSSNALYGFSIASDDAYTYLYAHCHRQFGWSPFPFVSPPVYVHDFGCVQKMTVARVPRGRFDVPMEYWDGIAWTANPATAANVVPTGRFASASQFYRTAPGKYVAVTKIGDWFGGTIEIDIATAPEGPYRTVKTIAVPPACGACNNYFASLLPYGTTTGQWIIGLSNNVFGPVDLSRYDPTFFATAPV
jgi:hypothetical protein